MRLPADTLINARWVITVEPQGIALEHHSVVVVAGRIVALLPTAQALAQYDAAESVDLPTHALIPGLVNAHSHAAMSLLRGYADELPLSRWLRERIWPAEARLMSDEFVHDGTLIAASEMLRGGVTCVNDMYFYPEAAARAYLSVGLRASIGLVVIDFPTRYASSADDYLDKGLAARDRLRDEPTLGFCLAPHAPYTVSDASLIRVAALAEELDLPIHTHVHETRNEIAEHELAHGSRPYERLRALGLSSSRLIAVHSVHLQAHEIAQMANDGVSVAHCPSSNLKLASGIAPVNSLIAAGVNLALGTDGAASNNRLDLMGEMRLASLLAKGVAEDPEALSAHQSLRAATLGGARAIGQDAAIGSISPGKWADLTSINLGAWDMQPCHDPVAQIVYVAGRDQVDDVWVAGVRRLARGALTTDRLTSLDNLVCIWGNRLVSSTSV